MFAQNISYLNLSEVCFDFLYTVVWVAKTKDSYTTLVL